MTREKQHEFDSLPWPEFHIQPGDLVRVRSDFVRQDQQGLSINKKNGMHVGNLYSHDVCVVLVVEDAHLFVLLHPQGFGRVMVRHGWEILKIS